MSASQYNAVNTQSVRPYIDNTIDAKLTQVINTKLISKNEKIALYFNDAAGTADSIAGTSAGAKNVFTQQITPSLDDISPSGTWSVLVDPAKYAEADYGVLIYKGPNCNVNVETTYSSDTNSNAFDIITQLYLNGKTVNDNYTGGRGYFQNINVEIQGVGIGATAKATVVNGNITAITAVNRGTKYSSVPSVVITGSGIEAKATVSVNVAKGIDTFTLSNVKPCASGIPGLFPTAANKPFGVSRRYNLNIVRGDRLELRVVSSDTSDTANCEVYQTKLEVLRPILIYQ